MKLIECIIAGVILSITLAFSLPIMFSIKQNNKQQIIEHDLKQAINTAKIYTLTTHKPAWLTHVSGTDDWSLGILLMIEDGSKAKIMHSWNWSVDNFSVTWHGFQSHDLLLFAQDLQHSAVNGYFIIKNKANKNKVTKIIINRLGRVRSEYDAS